MALALAALHWACSVLRWSGLAMSVAWSILFLIVVDHVYLLSLPFELFLL